MSSSESVHKIPAYLREFEDVYRSNPRQAALEWISNTRFGLFIHYGLYSIVGTHEWMQLRDGIPVQEYEKLTGVPVLLNTSFNVAGNPLVETVEEAIGMFNTTKIDVLWFPENGRLLEKII